MYIARLLFVIAAVAMIGFGWITLVREMKSARSERKEEEENGSIC